MRPRAALLAAGGMAALGLLLAPSAGAACHAFEVSVDPAQPGEGTDVTVTVTRDAAVNPSSVRVRTEDGSATGGQDFEPVDRRVEFTTGTSQTFSLAVLDDGADEPDETFQILLSEGSGCQVNPNFTYGSATVTVIDDDEPATPAPSATQPAPTSPGPAPAGPTTSSAEAPSTTSEMASSTSEARSTRTTGEAPERDDPDDADDADDDDDDGQLVIDDDDGDDEDDGAVMALAAAAVLAAAGGVAYVLFRRSRSGI